MTENWNPVAAEAGGCPIKNFFGARADAPRPAAIHLPKTLRVNMQRMVANKIPAAILFKFQPAANQSI
jgi:hypothetical protein